MNGYQDILRKKLAKQGYHLVANGAVKPCLWLNRSLRGGDQCYKHHFYGISSHRCVQMTPTLQCNHLCLHCWRPIDEQIAGQQNWAEPKELMDGILFEQKRIISGYGGSATTNMERHKEASRPAHVAISLMGEPTLYPYLKELIKEIEGRGMTSFLVTNGTRPEILADLEPSQLYLSLNASSEEQYHRISNPLSPDLWEQIQHSLAHLKDAHCRTVVRLTMVRGLNMMDPQGYARLLEMAEPDFIEVKAYMHLGRSRARLGREAMPEHSEIMEFANVLSHELGYELSDEVVLSRVGLLSKGRKRRNILDK